MFRIDKKDENNEIKSVNYETDKNLTFQTSSHFLSYFKSALKDFMDFAFWPVFTV